MNTRETYLTEAASQLARLDREITSLKYRVEESSPEVLAESYRPLKALRAGCERVERGLQDLRAEEGGWAERRAQVERELDELHQRVEALGPQIWPRLSDNLWKFR